MNSEENIQAEILELTKENNQLLKKMRRAQFWGSLFSTFKWAVIIGSSVGIYYYFQPIFNQVWQTYGQLFETMGNIRFPN